MNLFLTALRPGGAPLHKTEVFAFLARLPRDTEFESVVEGPFAAVVATGSRTIRPMIARHRHLLGVGDVRLDNRSTIASLAGHDAQGHSDLQLVLGALDARGADVVRELHGDFAFVAWDSRAQKIVAARDAFGVKSLFVRRTDDILLFASRAAPLAAAEPYDPDFLREFLLGMPSHGNRTVWRGVSRLEPGTVFQQRGTADTIRKYWAPDAFAPAREADARASVLRFRELFGAAVQQRVDDKLGTWAQLSGGLDSSAIVCTAEQLLGPGHLKGTVTLVDSLGEGDERQFSDLVVRQTGIRNEQIQDAWPWQNATAFTPTDEPHPLYAFQSRDQRMRGVMLSNQARVMLSGLGSDHYLFGNLGYIPDLILAGRVLSAARELAGWSLATRQSFWHMARRHAVAPLLGTRKILQSTSSDAARFPRWLGDPSRVTQDFARLYDFMVRPPRRRMFAHYTARELRTLPSWVNRDGFEDGMEVRYPFLSRPLVEFALQLPVHLRVQPFARKHVLREAMRGVLPEPIRTRQSKGGIDARILWSLQHENHTLQALLREPILADLGVIEPEHLRTAVDEARCGVKHNLLMLLSALSLETWLAVRDGRTTLQRKAA